MNSPLIFYAQNSYIILENCTISHNYYFQNMLFFLSNIFTIILKSSIIEDCKVESEVRKR